MSKNYKVEIHFKGFDATEKSYHYDCDSPSEAVSEALENLDSVWIDRIITYTTEELE